MEEAHSKRQKSNTPAFTYTSEDENEKAKINDINNNLVGMNQILDVLEQRIVPKSIRRELFKEPRNARVYTLPDTVGKPKRIKSTLTIQTHHMKVKRFFDSEGIVVNQARDSKWSLNSDGTGGPYIELLSLDDFAMFLRKVSIEYRATLLNQLARKLYKRGNKWFHYYTRLINAERSLDMLFGDYNWRDEFLQAPCVIYLPKSTSKETAFEFSLEQDRKLNSSHAHRAGNVVHAMSTMLTLVQDNILTGDILDGRKRVDVENEEFWLPDDFDLLDL